MRRLTSIVAVNRAGVIGCRNSLPWRLKSDLAFFRSVTSENVVLMGRKTYDSLGRCLPKRYNVILSKQFGLIDDGDGCVLRTGIVEGLAAIENAPSAFGEAFVIGGATIYQQFHSIVDRYLITIVDKDVVDGDAFFDLDAVQSSGEWRVERVANRDAGDGDEAPYEILEFTAKDAVARAKRRALEVEAFLSNRLVNVSKTPRKRVSHGKAGLSLSFEGF